MNRALILMVVTLARCSGAPPQFPECPPKVAVPAVLRKGETVNKLEIRVELAREAERARGDACAARGDAMQKWIEGSKK